MQPLIHAPAFVYHESHFREPHVPIVEAQLVPTHVTAWERRLEPLLNTPTYMGYLAHKKTPPP
jgi:hypothetical protein